MKKTILLIAVTFVFTQSNAQNNLSFGLRLNPEFTALLNKTDANAGDELDYAKHFGYASFGFGTAYNMNHIGFAVDILFSREGQAFTGNINGASENNNYSSEVALQSFLAGEIVTGNYTALAELNFIKVPLMLSLSSDRSKVAYFNCLVGPQLNFLQGVAQEVNGKDHTYPNTNIEPKDLYKPLTLDGILALGGGLNIFSHFEVTAHLRFDYGFSDVENKDVTVSYLGLPAVNFYNDGRSSTHNATAALMVGLNFKL